MGQISYIVRMFKKFRIAVLLFILFIIAADTYLTKYRAISWDETLWVAVYPINVDSDPAIERYISTLSSQNFEGIEKFFSAEAEDFKLKLKQPFDIHLAHSIRELPPSPPTERSIQNIMWWSLKLRYWAWANNNADFSPHIKIFVIYHNYVKEEKLAHSLGMEKGMIGVVHAFAHRELSGKNNFVIAHELLHTLGASDKYSSETGEPIHPEGYAEPDKQPRYPQRYAELMGGAIPENAHKSVMPRSLRRVVMGNKTAQEINWLAPK